MIECPITHRAAVIFLALSARFSDPLTAWDRCVYLAQLEAESV